VLLQYYKLAKQPQLDIYLEPGENTGLDFKLSGSAAAEETTDLLSNIIDKLNATHGTAFGESEKLAVGQITSNLRADKDLELKARVNTLDDFKHAFIPAFLNGVIQEFDKNQNLFGRILQDEEFKNTLMNLVMLDYYTAANEGRGANT